MKSLLVAAVAALVLAGCATPFSASQSAQPSVMAQNRLLSSPARASNSIASIDGDFRETLSGCQSVLSGFERQALQAKQWSVGIKTIGGLFGAVLLPVAIVKGAADSIVTLFGALSGFANTEESVVSKEALDATAILISRASVITSMQGALTKYYAARSSAPVNTAQMAAATDELRAACITYFIQSPQSGLIDTTQ
jgi:uncharacterized protein YceK